MKLTRSKTFVLFLLFFIFGVTARSFVAIPVFAGYAVALAGATAAVIFWEKKHIRIFGLCGVFFFLGVWRYALAAPVFNEGHIAFFNGEKRVFRGIVAEEPDVRENEMKITIEATALLSSRAEYPVRGRVLATTGLFPEYEYGDELVLDCALRAPEPFEDFAYDKYLARYRVYSLCYFPKRVELQARERGNMFLQKVFSMKHFFVDRLNTLFPEPQASFLGGLLYGARRGIPDDILEYFQRTGTTHIIAVSGYNITILAVIIQRILVNFYVSRKKAFWVTIVGILFFVIFTGAPASVVRAGVMGILALLAVHIGRPNRMVVALVLAAAVMLAANPLLLRYDVGFALSFLATIGLIFFAPLLDARMENLKDPFGLKESFTSTIAATVFTLPIILVQFSRLSLISPLANLFILPVIPWAMGTGFLAVMAGSVWHPIGYALSVAPWFLLSYVIAVAETFSRIPFASVSARAGVFFAGVWYGALLFWMWRERKKIKTFA